MFWCPVSGGVLILQGTRRKDGEGAPKPPLLHPPVPSRSTRLYPLLWFEYLSFFITLWGSSMICRSHLFFALPDRQLRHLPGLFLCPDASANSGHNYGDSRVECQPSTKRKSVRNLAERPDTSLHLVGVVVAYRGERKIDNHNKTLMIHLV